MPAVEERHRGAQREQRHQVGVPPPERPAEVEEEAEQDDRQRERDELGLDKRGSEPAARARVRVRALLEDVAGAVLHLHARLHAARVAVDDQPQPEVGHVGLSPQRGVAGREPTDHRLLVRDRDRLRSGVPEAAAGAASRSNNAHAIAMGRARITG